ncbi:MAG: DUF2442 domain-containing protein [Gemmatimonas sp.]|nr:DUF2442 domain-containing protein [Gemmatimonas sp.]
MTTSPIDHLPAFAQTVQVTDDTLTVDLADGRSIAVPLAWYPRLAHGIPAERANWRLIGRGEGIHWPDLDEDISVENLLSGARSGESQRSFKQWIAARGPAT